MMNFRVSFLFISMCSVPFHSFSKEVGVGIHFKAKDENDAVFKMLSDLNMNSFRTDYSWGMVEKKKGIYQSEGKLKSVDDAIFQAKNKGIKPLVILAYGNVFYTGRGYPITPEQVNAFTNYASWVATRFKGKVEYYEIWNEWKAGTGVKEKSAARNDSEKYLELVKATATKIRKIDPNAKILAGGMTLMSNDDIKWAETLIDRGMLNYIDGLSVHNYNYNYRSAAQRTPEYSLMMLRQFEESYYKKENKYIDIYLTEVGYPTCEGKVYCVDPKTMKKYYQEYNAALKDTSYIKGVWWYDLKDDGIDKKNKENNFGLYDFNGIMK
ncbi:cellulase family glycosylhydrolase [Raoultella ornithinolytica]|uniref:cellulase family glycosylhydrolase n=1 Tax=Raoultella ornithinolytica TaxID=54291 RepID=UPI001F3CB0AC|nr:cellulase family glycosylhydrolase [Raoultella ornithinolytica]MCF1303372.1 glycoside hydrolase family 5 protein [Raoultella ornithinolytica]